jgi:hypothetical protein
MAMEKERKEEEEPEALAMAMVVVRALTMWNCLNFERRVLRGM